MESIQELREMLQKEKVAPQGWRRPLGYYALQRFPSIYITRFLLPTPLTPNQITVIGFFIGLIGCVFVLQWAWHLKLIGIGLLYLNVLFDKVDGELARYKKIYSLKGIYLDYVNHFLIPPLFLLALTFGLLPFSLIHPTVLLLAGIAAACAMILLRIQQNLAEILYVKKYVPNRDRLSLPETLQDSAAFAIKQQHPVAAMLLWLFHHVQEHFLHLFCFTLALVIERYMRADFIFHPLMSWLLLVLGIALPLMVVENIIKGWVGIESRIAEIKKRTE
jgi:phosphatidylglycerophosphate synthase